MERLADHEPLLVVDGLTLGFGGVRALTEVSFEVFPGELLALIGPNGAGKTSIFNCLNGVYRPHRGSIVFAGEQLVGSRPERVARLGIGRTFQNLGLFVNLDVVDNLMLGRHHLMRTGLLCGALWWGRAHREEVVHRRRCDEIAAVLGLERYRRQQVGTLPYGIQKRVELGRALAMEPMLLLLDEPVAGMSLEETDQMARLVLRVQEELGLTIILVEHDVHLVMDLADRILVLDFGQVIACGAPADVQRDPRVIQAYLGVRA